MSIDDKDLKELKDSVLNIDNLDKNLQKLIAGAELDVLNVRCALNHGIEYDENPMAIDYLCQSFGKVDSNSIDATVQIPICSECLVSLYSEYQLLFLCINCISSQWLFKPEAKFKYNDDTKVIFVTYCPKCYEENLKVRRYEV